MTVVRGVWPRQECAARSSGPQYASTSISRPHRSQPSVSRTSSLPMRSFATSSVSRAKKPGPSTRPAGRDLSANTCDYMRWYALVVPTTEIIDEELNDHGNRHHDLA